MKHCTQYEIFNDPFALVQIEPASYPRLERCWMEDIKKIGAYYLSLLRKGGPTAETAYEQYCTGTKERLWHGPKFSCSEFAPIREYLLSNYYSEARPDKQKIDPLIAAKVRRLSEKTRQADNHNRLLAEAYAMTYYSSNSSGYL